MSLIDVERGVDMSYDVTAIVNFTTEVNHTEAGDISPNLSTGNNLKTKIQTEDYGIVSTLWESPIYAVTALFMQAEITNDYIVDATINAKTDWVNFYPTRAFYTDRSYYDINLEQTPFIPVHEGCDEISFASYNRDQQASLDDIIWPTTPPPGNYQATHCWGVNTASVNQFESTDTILGSNLQMDNWIEKSGFDSIYNIEFTSGWMKYIYQESSLIGSGENGEIHTIYGRPVLGFIAQRYINNNAEPGVIANYAVIQANKGKRKLTIEAPQ